jgi:hypothetical protein
MNVLANTILQRVLDRYAGGGGFMSRVAAAGILRLALRWPAFTVIMILSVVAARALSARRRQPDDVPPVLRAGC